jgi:hypothetical protein
MGLIERDEAAEHAESLRLLRLIREEPAWALSRVKRAAELEASLNEALDPPRGGPVAPDG